MGVSKQALCKLSPSDNSVVEIDIISLRLVVAVIGNQMQIKIPYVFTLQRNRFNLVHGKISTRLGIVYMKWLLTPVYRWHQAPLNVYISTD